MPQTQEIRASLGCGTLILIAVIVMLFGGHRDHDNLEKRIESLTKEVQELRRELQARPAGGPSTNVEQEVERVLTERERRNVQELAPKFREMFAEMGSGVAFAEEPQTYQELLAPVVKIIQAMQQ